MTLALVVLFICGAYVRSLEIYGNKIVPDSTIKSVFPRELENFDDLDFSSLPETIETNRKRDSSPKKLRVSAFGDNYHMQLSQAESTLLSKAQIVTRNGDTEEVWTGPRPDCFLTGKLTSHNGIASFSNCDRLEGILSSTKGAIHVREVPKEHNKHFNFSDQETVLMFGKLKTHGKLDFIKDMLLSTNDEVQSPVRNTRRELTTEEVVVELGVYTDSSFTAQFPSTDVSKRVELMILKYNGAQMEFSRSEILGYNIKLKIKNIEFWDTNPSFYNMSNKLYETLSSFCQGTRNVSDKYDIRCAHTAVPADWGGMAYIGGACTDFDCSVDAERSLTGYTALAHEIGHNLGMNHDGGRCNGSDVGIMGGYGAGWSSCSVNDLHNFLQLEKAQCLFREAEALTELSSSLIGQEYSPDDICKNRYGPNFFLRKFNYYSHCAAYSCVNLTEGALYGQMFNFVWQDIPGSYCGEGKICFKLKCTTFEDARQTPKMIRPGGWGPWGEWQSCSRTCGLGVTYRRRRCNNPSPINHPGCEGGESNANEAKICNPEPCSDDSPKQEDLIKQRASETCLRMLENKVLNSSEYNSTGDRYGHAGNDVCEVKCKAVGEFKSPHFARFGLMPHGTPCDAKITDHKDFMSSPWPRKKGLTPICLEGNCRIFGCDDAFLGGTKEFDGCGVCGGDGSTCDVKQGTFTGIPGQGNRTVMIEIPKGAYNIQIWLNWWIMEDNFIEMYNKDDVPVVVSNVGSSWVWNTEESKNPVNFANTYWYYKFFDYLHTTGPISEPAIIKLYQKKALENKGIHYAYSVPKYGECKNKGTYNLKLRTCDCPTGFYGADCGSRCNIYCFNGAALDESTCTCQCKEHQSGRYCKCEAGYTGKDCTERKNE